MINRIVNMRQLCPRASDPNRSAPGVIRTPDARFRKPTLYPLSYGGYGDTKCAPMIDLTKVIARRADVLGAITRRAGADARVGALLLVGSLATGTNDAYSDIDLVVIAEDDSEDALLDDRRGFPAQFGDVLLQVDSSWNVWNEAAQVLTLLGGDLPLWVDIDFWPAAAAALPTDARLLTGTEPPPVAATLAELMSDHKEAHGVGQVAVDNVDGALDVAGLAWRLKAIARGHGGPLADVQAALDAPWPAQLERAREPLRRFANHVASFSR